MRAALALGVGLSPRPDPLLDRGRPVQIEGGEHRGHHRLRRVDESVVVDVHEPGGARRRLGDVELDQPVDVLAHELQHVAPDLVRIRVRGGPLPEHVGQAAVRGQRLHGIAMGHHEPSVRMHAGDRIEREQVARPLQGPPAFGRAPLQESQHPGVELVGLDEVGGVQQVLEVARDRHRPQQPGVDEGLVEDGQALLRTVDVGEVERVDLAARRRVGPPRVLDARLVPPADGVGVGRGRRHRPFTFPRAQHPQVGFLVEEVLEVRRSRSREPGEEDRPCDR